MPDSFYLDPDILGIARSMSSGSPTLASLLRDEMHLAVLEMPDPATKRQCLRRARDRAKDFLRRRQFTDSHFLSLEQLSETGFQISQGGALIPPGLSNQHE